MGKLGLQVYVIAPLLMNCLSIKAGSFPPLQVQTGAELQTLGLEDDELGSSPG